jgi:hypothetical protein
MQAIVPLIKFRELTLFSAKGTRIVVFLKLNLSKNNVKYILENYSVKFNSVA